MPYFLGDSMTFVLVTIAPTTKANFKSNLNPSSNSYPYPYPTLNQKPRPELINEGYVIVMGYIESMDKSTRRISMIYLSHTQTEVQ